MASLDPDWVKTGAELAAIIVTASGFFFKMRADIRILTHDIKGTNIQLKALNENFLAFGKVMTDVAVQNTRLNHMEEDIREMKHGRGFVANGEYGGRK